MMDDGASSAFTEIVDGGAVLEGGCYDHAGGKVAAAMGELDDAAGSRRGRGLHDGATPTASQLYALRRAQDVYEAQREEAEHKVMKQHEVLEESSAAARKAAFRYASRMGRGLVGVAVAPTVPRAHMTVLRRNVASVMRTRVLQDMQADEGAVYRIPADAAAPPDGAQAFRQGARMVVTDGAGEGVMGVAEAPSAAPDARDHDAFLRRMRSQQHRARVARVILPTPEEAYAEELKQRAIQQRRAAAGLQ